MTSIISEIRLHEIPAAVEGMLDLVQVDDETGEIAPASLEAVQIASQDKLLATAAYIRRVEFLNEATKETIKNLQDRVRADSKRVDALKMLMTSAMDSLGYTEVKSPEMTLKFRKSQAVIIDDETLIPAEYLRTKTVTEPNKVAIKEAFKAGTDVQGARLVDNRNLTIK